MHELKLPPELTIYTVGELRPAWIDWVCTAQPDDEPSATVRLDGSAVDQVDAAGVQLLLSLAHAMGRRGRTLRVHRPSAPLSQACHALGVADALPLDVQEQGA